MQNSTSLVPRSGVARHYIDAARSTHPYQPAAELCERIFLGTLRWASDLTVVCQDFEQVLSHARVIFAFVMQATSRHDLDLRRGACTLVGDNRQLACVPPDDDPHRFVREAARLYTAARHAGTTQRA